MTRPKFVWFRCSVCGSWMDCGPWSMKTAFAVHSKRCDLSHSRR